MARKIFQEKKKTLLFLSIIILFALTLGSCNWFKFGLINVFDPQAQIRIDYKLGGLTSKGVANISFNIFTLNEVEFIGKEFLFEYYVEGKRIDGLTRVIGAKFYVPPESSYSKPVIVGFPLYFQDVLDYMTLNPQIIEIDATITVVGTDGTGNPLSEIVTFDLPMILPGIDFVPPTASFIVLPGTTGFAPFTVVLDASISTDDRGIGSYSWNFGDNSSGTGQIVTNTYNNPGTYVIILTVTDYWGNEGYATDIITVEECEECEEEDG